MTFDLYVRFALALAFVLALIVAFAWVARRTGLGGMTAKPIGRQRRLAVVEALSLDPKRRLVIVRRDRVEHLIVLGPAGETVIERGIPSPDPFTLPGTDAAR